MRTLENHDDSQMQEKREGSELQENNGHNYSRKKIQLDFENLCPDYEEQECKRYVSETCEIMIESESEDLSSKVHETRVIQTFVDLVNEEVVVVCNV